MQITLELPEDIAEGLESKWKDLPRAALESLALEAYRPHCCTASAAPRFRDADAGRRLSQGARNLRLLCRGFRTGSRDSSGAPNERGSALSSALDGRRRRHLTNQLPRSDRPDRDPAPAVYPNSDPTHHPRRAERNLAMVNTVTSHTASSSGDSCRECSTRRY